MTQLEKLKKLLGISLDDDSKDFSLEFISENVQETVKNYCNITEIPKELETFIQAKVVSIFRYESNEYKGVKSISEGDTKIDFAIENNGADNLTYSLNDSDKKILRNFRKIKF
ncbi:phage head-tail connector protein [Clostridium sp.]|uniref:phage head-tail connector protein n=1 Tax=Clostridium sp. TaxID=1506 RepID=UPI003216B35D